MPIPLYGFVEGDTLGLLVLCEETDNVLEVARKLQDAASIRVAPHDAIEVVYHGKALDPGLTVAQAGFEPLDRIDVIRRDGL